MTPEQGWSQMTAILDEAMPVARRSRRTLIYWWSAAAVASFAIIALIVLLDINTTFSDQFSANQSKELQKSQPVITNDDKVSESTSVTKTTEEQAITNGSPSETTTATSESAPTDNISETHSNSPSIANQTSKTKKVTTNSIVLTEEHFDDLAIIQQQEDLHATNVTRAIDAANETAEIDEYQKAIDLSDNRNDAILAFLPLNQLDEFDINNDPEIITEPSLKKRSSKFRPHLAAGILRSFSNGLGVNFGGGLNVHLGGKFSLTGDVAYQYYDTDASLAFGSSQDVEQGPNEVIRTDLGYLGYGDYLPAEIVNNSSNQVISPFVKDLHQWQLSGGVRYDVSRKFFAEAGAMLSFGIIAHSSYPIIGIGNNDPLTGDFFNISNSFNTFDIVKSTTTSVYGGIGYKLSPRTEAFAQVVHGLDHYLQNPETLPSTEATKRTDYLRGINVGLRHHLTAGP